MRQDERHTLTGLLLLDAGQPVLQIADGGTWRLQVGRRAQPMLGQRVTIEGTRVRFDALYVESIRRAGDPAPPRQSWWSRLFG